MPTVTLLPIPAGTQRVYTRGDLATRFWPHVEKGEGCWRWTGAQGRTGHGTINLGGGRFGGAHRVAYTLTRGPIPEGMSVCHTCDNGWCVRPEHLFLGTQGDNIRDMIAKGRGRGQFTTVTHCLRGHEYTPENTKRQRHSNCRSCRQCERDRCRRVRAARVADCPNAAQHRRAR